VKIVENLRTVGALPRTLLEELTALPQPPSWWDGLLPLPKIPPLSTFDLLDPNEKSRV